MSTDATPAASSPAPAAPEAAPRTIESLNPSERASWRMTGDLPSSPADSTPAPAGTQPALTDATPPAASKPATPPKNAESRKAELAREVQELLDRRNQLRQELAAPTVPKVDATPAASSAATDTPRTMAQMIQTPDVSGPPLSDAQFFQQFPEASLGDYGRYTARYEVTLDRALTTQQSQQAERSKAVDARKQSFSEQRKAAIAADPSYEDSIAPDVAAIVPLELVERGTIITADHIIAQEIFQHPTLAATFMRHLSDHPETFAMLRALPSTDAIVRAMGRLEAQLEGGMTPTSAPNTVSKAPAPPPVLGGKPAVPADDADSAVAAGDFRRFRDAENRRALAGK